MITPTVTIGLHEYETLKKIESAMMQKPFITYHYYHGLLSGNTLMFIINADDSTKKMVDTLEWHRKQQDILVRDIDKARNKIVDLEIQLSKKKWYQIWK